MPLAIAAGQGLRCLTLEAIYDPPGEREKIEKPTVFLSTGTITMFQGPEFHSGPT